MLDRCLGMCSDRSKEGVGQEESCEAARRFSGTINGLGGERPITCGRVSGDAISFTVENAERGNQVFKGTLAGDKLKMTRTGRSGEPRPFTTKRVK